MKPIDVQRDLSRLIQAFYEMHPTDATTGRAVLWFSNHQRLDSDNNSITTLYLVPGESIEQALQTPFEQRQHLDWLLDELSPGLLSYCYSVNIQAIPYQTPAKVEVAVLEMRLKPLRESERQDLQSSSPNVMPTL
jgi:hypothetical protein